MMMPEETTTSPYSVSIDDPETARSLFREGATLLFLNVPLGTLIGLDGQVFTVGPNFMGVKMIPPGVHLVTTQAVQAASRHDDDQAGGGAGGQGGGGAAPPPAAAPALAAFVELAPRSTFVRGWDARAEALAPLQDAEEEERFAAGARRGDFDRGLAPYDLGAVPSSAAAAAREAAAAAGAAAAREAAAAAGAAAAREAAAAAAGAANSRPAMQSGWARWRELGGLITPALARRLMPPAGRLPEGRECAAPLSVTAEAAGEQHCAAEEGGGAAAAPVPASAAERRLDAQLAEGRRREQWQQSKSGAADEGVAELTIFDAAACVVGGGGGGGGGGASRRVAVALAPAPEPSRARYTPVARLCKEPRLTPAELTASNLDKSGAAEALLRAVVERGEEAAGRSGQAAAAAAAAAAAVSSNGGAGAGSERAQHCSLPLARLLRLGGPLLLGELQFAFAAFAAGGQSLEGFHQWRSLVSLLLACERLPFPPAGGGGDEAAAAAAAARAFYAAFLRVLAAQLRYALSGGGSGAAGQPAPLLVDDDFLRQRSFLRSGVRRFLSALRAAEAAAVGGEPRAGSAGGGGGGGGGGGFSPNSSSPSGLGEVRAAAALLASALREGLGCELEGGGGGRGDEGEGEGDDDDDEEDDGPTVVDLDEGYAL